MANRYLDDLPMPRKKGQQTTRTLLLWILLIVMLLAIWQFLSPSDRRAISTAVKPRPTATKVAPSASADDPPSLTGLALITLPALVFVGLYALRSRRRAEHVFSSGDVETALLREDLDGAIAGARKHLGVGDSVPYASHRALMVLGTCAEWRGDFREAEEIFARAEQSFSRTLGGSLRDQAAPFARARRAFSLATLDRLDEAEALLVMPVIAIVAPAVRPLVVRARALVLTKRGRHREILDLLQAERSLLRSALTQRDATVLRMLAAHAKAELEDTTRSAAADTTAIDPDLRPWLARILPNARPLAGMR
jgi:hypothetical protein